jgi:hypothetical protein
MKITIAIAVVLLTASSASAQSIHTGRYIPPQPLPGPSVRGPAPGSAGNPYVVIPFDDEQTQTSIDTGPDPFVEMERKNRENSDFLIRCAIQNRCD